MLIRAYQLGIIHANIITNYLLNQSRTKSEGWSNTNLLNTPTGHPKVSLLFWLFMLVLCICVSCFLSAIYYLYIIELQWLEHLSNHETVFETGSSSL